MECTPHVVLCMAELSFCLLLITDLILCVHTHIYASMCMCVHVHMYICLSERLCMPDTERVREREEMCVCALRACDTTTMTTKYLTSVAQIHKNNCVSFHNTVQYYNSSIVILLKITL